MTSDQVLAPLKRPKDNDQYRSASMIQGDIKVYLTTLGVIRREIQSYLLKHAVIK